MDGSNDTAVVECCRRGNYHEFTELTARKSFVLLWALPGGKGYVWVSFDLPMIIVVHILIVKKKRADTIYKQFFGVSRMKHRATGRARSATRM